MVIEKQKGIVSMNIGLGNWSVEKISEFCYLHNVSSKVLNKCLLKVKKYKNRKRTYRKIGSFRTASIHYTVCLLYTSRCV